MTKRQDNERAMQSKIDQLQREMEQMRYAPVALTTIRAPPTPAEKYVQPRSRVISLHHLFSSSECPFDYFFSPSHH